VGEGARRDVRDLSPAEGRLIDHIALARSSLAAAGADVTPKVRQIHLAVARNSFAKAHAELASLEILLVAKEAQLAIDGVGE
jgi:hypothetical protein